MLRPPCKNCEFREVGCHAKCKTYMNWAKEHETAREKDRTERVINFTLRKLKRERWKKHDRNK